MRIRTVKPDFWEDETVQTMSLGARLLFIASFNQADDEGLLRWNAPLLKSLAFAYDIDILAEHVQTMMNELVAAELVFPYSGGKSGQRLAYIINFRKHQRINRPQASKLPAPRLDDDAVPAMYGHRDKFTCHKCQGAIAVDPTDGSTNGDYALAVGHMKPRSSGGTDHPSNIAAFHAACRPGAATATSGGQTTSRPTTSMTVPPLVVLDPLPAPSQTVLDPYAGVPAAVTESPFEHDDDDQERGPDRTGGGAASRSATSQVKVGAGAPKA